MKGTGTNTDHSAFFLMETIERIVRRHAPPAVHKPIVLELLGGGGEPIRLTGDVARFQGVVNDLVVSAMAMTNQGEIRVRVAVEFVDRKKSRVRVGIEVQNQKDGLSDQPDREGEWRCSLVAACILAHATGTGMGQDAAGAGTGADGVGSQKEACVPSVSCSDSAPAPGEESCLAKVVLAGMKHDRQTVRTYVQLLHKDIKAELQHLHQAVAAQDRAAIKSAAHSLKGLCGSLRNPLPGDLARTMQREAESAPWAELLALAKHLQHACGAVAWDP